LHSERFAYFFKVCKEFFRHKKSLAFGFASHICSSLRHKQLRTWRSGSEFHEPQIFRTFVCTAADYWESVGLLTNNQFKRVTTQEYQLFQDLATQFISPFVVCCMAMQTIHVKWLYC